MREKHILVIFTNSTCFECKKGATEIAKLAQMLANENIKVARADCSFDHEPCDLFVNHLKSSNGTFPYIMLLSEFRSYVYDGPILADNILKNFI